MKRAAGILLPVSSLPGPYGIGCFSRHARRFVDYLAEAGQSYWQILPLGPTGYGDSPYQSFSAFAGNPYFIDLEKLVEEELLTREECEAADLGGNPGSIDYGKLYRARYALLRTAFSRADLMNDLLFEKFEKEESAWANPYSEFMALKGYFGGKAWTEWPEDARLRDERAMERYRDELGDEGDFYLWMQYKFREQWELLRWYAHERGIQIIGDIPIYAAMDSADVWANPELFQMDGNRRPTAVAGCPPDGFSATGQLWGNPLYNWDYHRETGYAWWLSRMRHCFRLYDVVRIDHFRGFDEYYSIPYGAETAMDGEWKKGPGLALFEAVERGLGKCPVIAEDLGYVTDSVRRLVRESGFPGMKVLEFAFDSRDTGSAADYLPHNYPENCAVYTGTHDNETVAGWLKSITPEEYRSVRDYLCDHYTPEEELYRPFTAAALRSRADLCVIPMQDYLGLDNSCRLNRPSTLGTNWRWRVREDQLTGALRDEIAGMARRYGRA